MAWFFTLILAKASAEVVGEKVRAEIDQYVAHATSMKKETAVPPNAAPAMELTPFEIKLERMIQHNEADYAAWLTLKGFLDQRKAELVRNASFNPYDDEKWRTETRTNLSNLCCLIEKTPPLKRAILARIQRNRDPLPRGYKHNHDLLAALRSDDAHLASATGAPSPTSTTPNATGGGPLLPAPPPPSRVPTPASAAVSLPKNQPVPAR